MRQTEEQGRAFVCIGPYKHILLRDRSLIEPCSLVNAHDFRQLRIDNAMVFESKSPVDSSSVYEFAWSAPGWVKSAFGPPRVWGNAANAGLSWGTMRGTAKSGRHQMRVSRKERSMSSNARTAHGQSVEMSQSKMATLC